MSRLSARDWAQLVRLKRLIERRAQADLGKALKTERDLDAEAANLQRRRLGEQGGWLIAMQTTPADLGLAGVWSRALTETEAALRDLEAAQRRARAAAEQARAQCARAQAEADLAEERRRAAAAREAYAREARALASVEDLIASRACG